ncbi:MAG: hypothetical protein A3D92_14735 [Bacteroidetes bacterium RIFCSPHIGHO2_02_FULL_44_7]|nr:MAG: hypothetical protein A3D92_14735 [Bacteroidetes bacterium RIFCSPHIGHO2_02_FULL_44_7]
MAITDVYDFYRKMEDEKIILSFKGEFTPDLLTSILNILETRMRTMGVERKKQKRVFNVLVECFQNLYHHIDERASDAAEVELQKSVLIMIKYAGDSFIVRTGNHLSNEVIPELRRKLAMVNALSTDELRGLYQAKLKNDQRSEKGTAGLGLIDIARKSGSKLEYEFLEIDKHSSFFCLNVVIE